MNLNKYNIRSEKIITSWDEALPLGNGIIGCLIYENEPIRLSLDRVDLWDNRPNPTTTEKGFTFKNLVNLVKSGKEDDWKEHTRLFDDIFSDTPYPTKLTAGRIELDFGTKGGDISYEIDICRAIANVKLCDKTRIEIFISATDKIGVAKIYGKFNCNLHIPLYISGDENGRCGNYSGIGETDIDACLHYPKITPKRDERFIYYRQPTLTDFEYGIVVYEKQCVDHVELYFTVATNRDYKGDFIAGAKTDLLEKSNLGYESLKGKHIAWWKKYWNKSEISIYDENLEKTYYRSYYLFASCSRKGYYPMPLQGVWTADNDSLPPWKGDYHHDTNTELSYQSYLKANRLDEGRVFIDYLWNLKSTFNKFAKDFFGVNGILLPSCSTLDGKAMGGWSQYSLSPTMTIWAAQSFDEFYLYTGDKTFLKERAYPFLKGVGDAIYELLEERNGKLYLPLSSSPEIFDNTRKSYLKPNSNFDLALMRYLYKTLSKYENILKIDGRSEEILGKLDEIAIDKDDIILLDSTQKLEVTHRHFSHLMCLYPLHLINYDTDEHKRIYQRNLFEIERLGMGFWVGFSYAMCSQIYAMANMGNAAYEKLHQFARGFVADNGFHLNGDFKNYGYTSSHYRPFTLEALFGYCDALQEMLLQEHQGYVHLFPAIPEEWKKREISFKKLRTYGGVLVSAKAKDGCLCEVSFFAPKKMTILIKNTFGTEKVVLKYQNSIKTLSDKNGYFEIPLEKGKNKCKGE